jgi:hypothetical protein
MNRINRFGWISLVYIISMIFSIGSLPLTNTSANSFNAAVSTFVEAGSVTGYRAYQQNNDDHGNHTFNPGETIELYIEPVGYSYSSYTDSTGNTLYTLNFSADIVISNAAGQSLFSYQDVPILADIDPAFVSEVFVTLNLTQQRSLLEGDYNITYTITDNITGQHFTIHKIVTIADTAGPRDDYPLVIDGVMTPGEWNGIINTTEFAFINGKGYNVTIALAPANENINMLAVIEAMDRSTIFTPENNSTVIAHLLSSQPDHVEDVAMIEIRPELELASTLENDTEFIYATSGITQIDGFWDINNPIEYQNDTERSEGTNDVIAASSFQMPGKQIIEMSHPLCSGDNYDLCIGDTLLSDTVPLYYSLNVGIGSETNFDPAGFYTPLYNATLRRGQLSLPPSISAAINNIIYESFESIEEFDKPVPFIIDILGKLDTIVRDSLLSNMSEAEREKMLTGPAESDISWFLKSLDADNLKIFFNTLDMNEIVSVLEPLYTTDRYAILDRLDKAAIDSLIGKLNYNDRISLFGEPDGTKLANMFR